MDAMLVVAVIAIAVASRPVEVRLWRAGRISDRTLAITALARFPIVSLVFGLIIGVPLPLLLVIAGLAVVPAILFYPFMRQVIRDQRRVRHRRLRTPGREA